MDPALIEMGVRYTIANVVLEVCCALVSFVLAMQLLLGDNKGDRQKRLLTRILFLNVLIQAFDAMAWAFSFSPNPRLRGFLMVVNYFEFTLAYLALIFLVDYIMGTVSKKLPVSGLIVRAVRVVFSGLALLVTISLFNGIVYYIDEQNMYCTGPLYDVCALAGSVMLLLISLIGVYYRRYLTRGEMLAFLSYGVFSLIATGLQVFFPVLMLHNLAYTLSFLLTYINIHVQNEKLFKDRELELQNARIAIMVSQIQPHFLYNALSAVSYLCVHDPKEARRAVNDFSHYLRANLAALTETEAIPFEKEIEHVGKYLSLEAKRFGEKMQVEYVLDATNFCLPPLTLQPIVENAVQHGIMEKEGVGTIVIRSAEERDAWVVSVTDDGVGFDESMHLADGVEDKNDRDARLGVGIRNVRFRLNALCRGTLEIASRPGHGTTATLRIPKEP